MDARLASYLVQPVDARPPSWRNEQGLDAGDSFTIPSSKAVVVDANNDGIPDGWRGTPCVSGYTPLECYLNEVADKR